MHKVAGKFSGIVLLARLNSDWVFTAGTVILALVAGALMATSMAVQLPPEPFRP